MKIKEREQFILEILEKQRFLSVKNLAEITYTSESSIRRDLNKLESLGFVKRSYGGVAIVGQEDYAAPIYSRKDKNRQAKREICQKASALLKDGMTILLDGSTTAFYMVGHIARFNDMQIITNSLLTASTATEQGITVYCTGGATNDGSPVLSGTYAEEMLEKVRADVLFFSSFALSDDGLITDHNERENKIRKIMLKKAKKKVLLIDKSKYGKTSTHVLCSLKDVDYVFNED